MSSESPTPSLLSAVRRRLAWSNSPRSWAERLGVVAVFSVAGSAYWFGGVLTLGQQIAVGLGLLAVLAIVLNRGWVKVFGPVLLYDLIRQARKRCILFDR